MSITRIIVVDSQELIAHGLRSWLADVEDMEVVAYASTGKKLFTELRTVEADLVLIDISIAEMDGIDATRLLHSSHPKLKVLAHSSLTEVEYANSMLIEGASGYLLKGCGKEEFITAVRTVMEGGRYVSASVQRNIDIGYTWTEKSMGGEYIGLTDREREVIRLIAMEKTNEEIGMALGVTQETVKSHRKHLMAKLDVRSTAGLVKYALDRKWI
ncbi:MAG: response regulator transcription factor [Flavobacteriales bacterium]|nr:response regulator transcription factor [Flavobacteriales bacterium]HQV76019.1 response regulator transcription factor [Flavobacteriales bacterium]HQW42171.1 response regulator transcription factor [Flavobacteriales bacterium]